MFKDTPAFSGFSVNDLEAAKRFYADTLGVIVEEQPGMGLKLNLHDNQVFVYTKPDHTPATYTILNFVVDDIDEAVDNLVARGVTMKQYDSPDIPQDAKGIAHGRAANMGPDIAWFTDPAGNILSVLQN